MDATRGDWSSDPFVTVVTPSFVDDTISPPGKHVVHLFGGHAPYTLREGDWPSRRDDFAKNVLRVVDEHAPGFSEGIIGMQVLAPPDIEAIIGSPHGHIFHGELQVDQLFFARPAPHYADYRSPIRGLYQCGASAHPGGGVGARGRTQRGPRDPQGPAADEPSAGPPQAQGSLPRREGAEAPRVHQLA